MDEAAPARAATENAVSDITPHALRDEITQWIQASTMTPGVLARFSARTTEHSPPTRELDDRTAGVQLIYTGLDLTRTLARTNPWTTQEHQSVDHPDLSVLAADVFVARGFSLLAHTQAASFAVSTIQSFGQSETLRATTPDPPEYTLEADIYELAIIAGTTLTHTDYPPGVRSFAHDLAATQSTPNQSPGTLLTPDTLAALSTLISDHAHPSTPPTEPASTSTITDS